MLKNWRSVLMLIFGIGVSVGFLYLGFSHVDFSGFQKELKSFSKVLFVAGLFLAVTHSFLMARKWQVFLSAFEKVSFFESFWSLRLSYFFNATLPVRLGEPIRIWIIRRNYEVATGKLIGATGADRVLDLVSLILLVSCALVAETFGGDFISWPSLLIGAVAILFGIILLSKLPTTSNSKIIHAVLQFISEIRLGIQMVVSKKIAMRAVSLSLAGWGLHFLMISIVASGVGLDLAWPEVIFVVAAVSLAVSIPSTPSNLGTFEFAVIFVLNHQLGYDLTKSASLAVLYHFIQILPTLLIGAYGFFRYRSKLLPKNILSMKSKEAA